MAKAEEKEPSAVVAIGPEGEWGFPGSRFSIGPSASVEFSVIKDWLEIEIGGGTLFSRGQKEWEVDALFKKPFTLSNTVELMVGAGPSWSYAPGIREELRNLARRIAKHGYFCLLPDMYYRIGTLRFDFVRRAEGMRPTMFAAMNSLTNALVTEDTAACLGFLDAQDKVKPGAIGCIGYCMSGRYVTTVAARFPNRFVASASLYGVGIVTDAEDTPHLLVDRIKGEMYFGFAETDEHVPANVIPTLKSALDKAGTRYGLDIFPNSRHGFQFPERDVYETHAAEESWSKIVAMWDRNLKGNKPPEF